MLQSADKILIFGAGQNGRMVARILGLRGLRPAGFLDDTPEKSGAMVSGLPVRPVAPADGARSVVICSIYSPAVSYRTLNERITALGYRSISLFEFLRAFAKEELPFYWLGPTSDLLESASEIEWLASRLRDDRSKQELLGHLKFRLRLDFAALPDPAPLGCDFNPGWFEFGLIDGGAYTGDTITHLTNRFSAGLLFGLGVEPDPANYAGLLRTIAACEEPLRSKLSGANAALADKPGTMRFKGGARQASRLAADGADEVVTVTVDQLAEERGSPKVICKLDVEGAESAAIDGAQRLIRAGHVALAISVYHRPDDLWRIPQQIHAMNPSYSFTLRSHGHDGSDLMIYALPR
ncbi:MAG: FkbM family methyltransferase [Mycobacterium sp.]|uniref:FkbM family methyltransferase n=1 Tax=Mycobacterium sp. TaxID=1785 RepID=UPI001ED0E60A|nr:FkbM family methyltransferase [Mycobacterium sp.]MBV8786784.1 FkbM family methyltransferase [Mycobacterium sp.]MBV9997043.1 FkbM family methyltransferase [Caulobacteraceae bacterium]